MVAFTYIAKDQEGKVIRSSVRAMSQTAALADLRTQGLAVVDISAEESAPEDGWLHVEDETAAAGDLPFLARPPG